LSPGATLKLTSLIKVRAPMVISRSRTLSNGLGPLMDVLAKALVYNRQ